MAARIILLCGFAVMHFQSAMSAPFKSMHIPFKLSSAKWEELIVRNELLPRGNEVSVDMHERREGNHTVVDPPKDIRPNIVTIPSMTKDELEKYVAELKKGDSNKPPRSESLETRQPSTTKSKSAFQKSFDVVNLSKGGSTLEARQDKKAAFKSFIDGDVTPPSKDPLCQDFTLKGPFLSIQAFMGQGAIRALEVVNYSGDKIFIGNNVSLVDAGKYEFVDNERLSKFSIAKMGNFPGVMGFKFETSSSTAYEALSTLVRDQKVQVTWTDIAVGSGIVGQIVGTNCQAVFGSFGMDFIDDVESISIIKIDYQGFSNGIMPTGKGTLLSVGSQILDNRNSTEKQTITLTTMDAITKQFTLINQIGTTFGGKVSVKAGVNIPMIGSGEVTTEASWSLDLSRQSQAMENSMTTRSGLFALACPAKKFCTARAFFMQYKLDVGVTSTMQATTKTGAVYNWIQRGQYKGADSLAMQFNVTEVDRVTFK